jgi:hypothetical protein
VGVPRSFFGKAARIVPERDPGSGATTTLAVYEYRMREQGWAWQVKSISGSLVKVAYPGKPPFQTRGESF